MAKKFRIELARLERFTKVVEVEAEDEDSLDLKEIYFEDDDEGDWESDVAYGCEEGTHRVLGEA